MDGGGVLKRSGGAIRSAGGRKKEKRWRAEEQENQRRLRNVVGQTEREDLTIWNETRAMKLATNQHAGGYVELDPPGDDAFPCLFENRSRFDWKLILLALGLRQDRTR